MSVKRTLLQITAVAFLFTSLLYMVGCVKRTPGCHSDEVKTLFRDGIVARTIDQSLASVQRSIDGSEHTPFLQPIYLKRHRIGTDRRTLLLTGFELSNIKTVSYDQEQDSHLCDASMMLPGLDGEVYAKDISFKIYPADKPDRHYEIEYGDWVESFTTDMLYQPQIDLTF